MEETFSCDAFGKDEDGNWHCIKAVTIKGPRGLLQIAEGMTFTKGVPYLGVDVAERLDEECNEKRELKEIPPPSSETERYRPEPSKKGEEHLPPRPSVM